MSCSLRASARTHILNCVQSWSEAAESIIPGHACFREAIQLCMPVSKFKILEPTSSCLGLGMVILCLRAARRSRTVRSMKVLLWSSVFCLGDGVGESEMIIGLFGVFGGVVSGEDGS